MCALRLSEKYSKNANFFRKIGSDRLSKKPYWTHSHTHYACYYKYIFIVPWPHRFRIYLFFLFSFRFNLLLLLLLPVMLGYLLENRSFCFRIRTNLFLGYSFSLWLLLLPISKYILIVFFCLLHPQLSLLFYIYFSFCRRWFRTDISLFFHSVHIRLLFRYFTFLWIILFS